MGCAFPLPYVDPLSSLAQIFCRGERVTDPEKLGGALTWRTSYAKQAELLEAQGNSIDARQARIKVQQLDDVMTIMRLQLQGESDGTYIPLHKVLPSAYRYREEYREEED
jgi:hypothetical protein